MWQYNLELFHNNGFYIRDIHEFRLNLNDAHTLQSNLTTDMQKFTRYQASKYQ